MHMRSRTRNRSSRRQDERGATQIEFVLTILVVLLLIFATWEMIMVVYTMNVLSDAAKEGVRAAIVRGTKVIGGNADWDPIPAGCPYGTDNIRCKVWDYARLSFHDISDPAKFNVAVSYPDGVNTDGYRIRVVVTYRYVPHLALPISPTLQGAAEGRLIN